MTHKPKTDREYLRQVTFGNRNEYCLRTWDTGRRFNTGQWKIGYTLTGPDGKVLFRGEDCGVAPSHSIDSDDALRGLVGFLTLKPGDTDEEYFEDYTPDQLDFAETDAEDLSLWGMELQSGDEHLPPRFTNIDDWEGEFSDAEKKWLARRTTEMHARCRTWEGYCAEHEADLRVPSCCKKRGKGRRS